MRDEDFDRACGFLNALGTAVQRYGVSSHSKESLLVRVAGALGVRGEFQAMPTQIQSILWKEGEEDRQRLHISVSSAVNFDLNKLARVSELADKVVSGEVPPTSGLDRLRLIEGASSQYGPGLDAMAFVLCGLGYGGILGASFRDLLLGGVLSLVSFGLNYRAARSPGLAMTLELVVAVVVSALATLACLALPGSNAIGVAVCGIVYFVPGFGLTLGVNELMVGNTLSGLIGFTRAVVTSLKLFVGVLIGAALVRGQVAVPPPAHGPGVPRAWTWLCVPMLVIGMSLLLRVRPRDLVWPLIGGLLVWLGVEAGSGIGFWQGTFLGAFVLSCASRIFARRSGLPAAIISLPAVMVLVPGLAALRALYVAEARGLIEGVRSAHQVLVLIAAIIAGALFGRAVMSIKPPRSAPSTPK